jgi:hypothetical protein
MPKAVHEQQVKTIPNLDRFQQNLRKELEGLIGIGI